jgi:methyl-galactoside transport system substrate-binding protein
MNKKVLTLSAVMASMLFGAAAHAADTRIGVTIYKYDDNFMCARLLSKMRKPRQMFSC